MDGFFTVIVVDGDFAEATDYLSGTSSIRYDGLSWADSVELARLSFMQGFEIVIWKQGESDGMEGGGGECGEKESG